MAVKWNILTGRKTGKKVRAGVEKKENVKNRPAEQQGDKGLTQEEIKSIVDREISAASMKNQMVKYFNNIESQGIRTEAILEELRTSVDTALDSIRTAAERDSENSQKIMEINAAVTRVESISRGLTDNIHKDNLLTYTNMKELIEQTGMITEKRLKGIKAGIITGIILLLLTAGGIVFSILLQLGIFAF